MMTTATAMMKPLSRARDKSESRNPSRKTPNKVVIKPTMKHSMQAITIGGGTVEVPENAEKRIGVGQGKVSSSVNEKSLSDMRSEVGMA